MKTHSSIHCSTLLARQNPSLMSENLGQICFRGILGQSRQLFDANEKDIGVTVRLKSQDIFFPFTEGTGFIYDNLT